MEDSWHKKRNDQNSHELKQVGQNQLQSNITVSFVGPVCLTMTPEIDCNAEEVLKARMTAINQNRHTESGKSMCFSLMTYRE